MFQYLWMAAGVIVTSAVVWLIIKEIRHSIQRSQNGEGSDYDFHID